LLESANIIINRNLLPWDIKEGRHYMNPSGLRLGTSEVTRLGMGKGEMQDIAEFFKALLVDKKDPKRIKKEIAEFRKDFQEIKYCFQHSNDAYEYLKFF
jgi:glycine hydroxymethyltransferase